jgi:hypothetical protein
MPKSHSLAAALMPSAGIALALTFILAVYQQLHAHALWALRISKLGETP